MTILWEYGFKGAPTQFPMSGYHHDSRPVFMFNMELERGNENTKLKQYKAYTFYQKSAI